MYNEHTFTDFLEKIDNRQFQELQNNFAQALDLAFITVDYRGRPLFEYSGFTDFCKAIRSREDGLELCYQCDAHGGLHSTITGEPQIYRCHTGLVDFAVPLILEGKYMGSVMGGQVILEGPSPVINPILTQTINWEEDPLLNEAFKSVHKTTYEKLIASVYLLRDMMQNLMEKEYRKIMYAELENKSQELREERATRVSLEEEIHNVGFVLSNQLLGSDFVLDMLNIVSQMAYLEGVRSIEDAACDFAYIMRYMRDNASNNFVTVGEELTFIEHYLRIQKIRFRDKLDYKITSSNNFESVLSPFMLLQPIIDNALSYGIANMEGKGHLEITVREEDKLLVITVIDNGVGMTAEQIASVLQAENRYTDSKNTKTLSRINYLFLELFGEECGLRIQSRDNNIMGTEVQIRLPVNNNSTFMKYFTYK